MALQSVQNRFMPEPADTDQEFQIPSKRGLLTPEEIEALLRPDLPEPEVPSPSVQETVPFPVQEQSETSKSDLANPLVEDAARLAARLTLALRSACQIDASTRIAGAVTAPLTDLVAQHNGELVLVLFCDEADQQVAGLTLDGVLAAQLIDQVCGGGGLQGTPRKLTRLDQNILEAVLKPLAPMLDPSFSIGCVEVNKTAAEALLPPDQAVLADMLCEIGGSRGKAVFAVLTDPIGPDKSSERAQHEAGHFKTIVTARLASLKVPVARLSDLKPGSVLLLGVPADQPVELLSGDHKGQVVAEGSIGRKGTKIAVKVTKCTASKR